MLDYKLWRIDHFSELSWRELQYPTENYALVFFTNDKHIHLKTEDGRVTEYLCETLGSKCRKSVEATAILNLSKDVECDKLSDHLLLVNDSDNTTLIGLSHLLIKTRSCLNANNTFSFLTNASFYSLFKDSVIHSALPIRQFLILPTVLKQEQPVTRQHLWMGEGWLTPLVKGAQEGKSDELSFDSAWNGHIDNMLSKLSRRSCYSLSEHKPNDEDIETRKKQYLAILESCIPFQRLKTNQYIPSHFQPWSGPFEISSAGPADAKLLRNGGVNSNFHSVIRDLILEGWLTMSKYDGKLLAHTGSFSLLYWTAKYFNKSYTDTPEEFLLNYDIHPKQGWFGGGWDKRLLD